LVGGKKKGEKKGNGGLPFTLTLSPPPFWRRHTHGDPSRLLIGPGRGKGEKKKENAHVGRKESERARLFQLDSCPSTSIRFTERYNVGKGKKKKKKGRKGEGENAGPASQLRPDHIFQSAARQLHWAKREKRGREGSDFKKTVQGMWNFCQLISHIDGIE